MTKTDRRTESRRRPSAVRATRSSRNAPDPDDRPAGRPGRPRPRTRRFASGSAETGPVFPRRPATAPTVIRADRRDPPEHLFRSLLAAYLGGASEYRVEEPSGLSDATRAVVRAFCRRTLGPVMAGADEDSVRIRVAADERPEPVDQRLARMGRAVLRVHREAVESWTELPWREDGYWASRDDEVDREAWSIERAILSAFGTGAAGASSLGQFTVVRSLERIGDHAVVLGEEGRHLAGISPGSPAVSLLGQLHRQAMHHLEGVLEPADRRRANQWLDLGEALSASGRALSDRLLAVGSREAVPPAAVAAVSRILDSLLRTVAYAQDIAEVALDGAPGRLSRLAPEPAARPLTPAAA